MNYFVVIPAFNEEKTLSRVLESVSQITPHIIVVDDGSTDLTYSIAVKSGARVYRHVINRGLGASLTTGIEAALLHGADAIITFDADGQHNAADIPRMIQLLEEDRADVVIGSRLLNKDEGMPVIRKAYNIVGNLITYVFFGMKVSDSQSGLRAFTSKSARLFKLRSNRMEVSSEFINEIKVNRLRYLEIPITPIYTQYSMSKGQGLFVGFKTLLKLIVLKILK
ncbi:MAG: glycosyltransferase family 2 protein [Patescibacteria group bacterium]|jgi:glycosyltransferase involved in cell wall biosynthesis